MPPSPFSSAFQWAREARQSQLVGFLQVLDIAHVSHTNAGRLKAPLRAATNRFASTRASGTLPLPPAWTFWVDTAGRTASLSPRAAMAAVAGLCWWTARLRLLLLPLRQLQ